MNRQYELVPTAANLLSDHAFFDGVFIRTDSICDPSRDRVLPILPEEQVFICRQMRGLLEKLRQDWLVGPRQEPLHVLDVGTGSGVLAIFADRVLNTAGEAEVAEVRALDISSRALQRAKINCEFNGSKNIKIEAHPRRYVTNFARPKSQDLILVNPPFNPTHKDWENRVAWHAATRADKGLGLSVFREWLPALARHLKLRGYIVGYHMSPVENDRILALDELCQALGSEAIVRFCRVLDADYETETFLREQYQDYLPDPLGDARCGRKEWEENWKALDQWIKQNAECTPSLALVYYEATNRGGNGRPEQTIQPVWQEHNAKWSDRTRLHRMIVNNVQQYDEELPLQSVASNIPVLLTATPDYEQHTRYWNLRGAGASELELQGERAKVAGASVLQGINNYLRDADILDKFDFLLIDSTPILPGPRRGWQIHQECMLWSGRSQGLNWRSEMREKLIRSYQLTTYELQQTLLAPFFHPWFVSPDVRTGWSRGWVSRMEGKQWLHSVNGHVCPKGWRPSLEYGKQYFRKRDVPSLEEQGDVFLVHNDELAGWVYSSAPLLELARTRSARPTPRTHKLFEWKLYLEEFKRRLGSHGTYEGSSVDLQACHWLMHRHLQHEAELVFGETGFSVLVGIPLCYGNTAVPEPIDLLESERLPRDYYGGVWLWAGRLKEEPPVPYQPALRDLIHLTLHMVERAYMSLLVDANYELGDEVRQHSFAHQAHQIVGSIINDLENCNFFKEIEPATWVALLILHVKTGVFRGNVDGQREFPALGAEPIGTYTRIAAAWAVERGLDNKAPTECQRQARHLRFRFGLQAPEEMLRQLDLQCDPLPEVAQAVVRTYAFGAPFILCLGQGLYHAFRHSIANPDRKDKPYVQFTISSTHVTVSIINPGEPTRLPPDKLKDVEELQELARALRIDDMSGPRYETDRRWLTQFRLRLSKSG